MKEQKEIERLYNFVSVFNDGIFMNQDYRKGIMDTLSFVLYRGEILETIMTKISNSKSSKEKLINKDIETENAMKIKTSK
jgi:hypothetical protein